MLCWAPFHAWGIVQRELSVTAAAPSRTVAIEKKGAAHWIGGGTGEMGKTSLPEERGVRSARSRRMRSLLDPSVRGDGGAGSDDTDRLRRSWQTCGEAGAGSARSAGNGPRTNLRVAS